MQLKLSASTLFTILVLAATGGSALNINRAAGALPAIADKVPNPAPPIAERSMGLVDSPGLGRRELRSGVLDDRSLKGELLHEGIKEVAQGAGENLQLRSAEGIVGSPRPGKRGLRSGVLHDRSIKGELLHEGIKEVAQVGVGNLQLRSAEDIHTGHSTSAPVRRSWKSFKNFFKHDLGHDLKEGIEVGASVLKHVRRSEYPETEQ